MNVVGLVTKSTHPYISQLYHRYSLYNSSQFLKGLYCPISTNISLRILLKPNQLHETNFLKMEHLLHLNTEKWRIAPYGQIHTFTNGYKI